MTKPLTRIENTIYHYVAGVKMSGMPDGLSGYVTGLHGDVTGLRGYVTCFQGNVDEIPYSARPCNISDWIEE